MPLNDISFIKGQGGLGRTLSNSDHKSGLIFYGGNIGDELVEKMIITSLAHAESLGVTEANFPAEHYHIKEFFRMQPNSSLYVFFGDLPVGDFSEVADLQNYADGELRQIGVMVYAAFDEDNIALLQAVAETLETAHKPLSILYAGDLTGVTLTNLPNLRALECPNVSVVIGMDGDNDGKALFDAGEIVTCLGATLGAVSLAAVNNNIGWVEKFNIALIELDVPAFANGELFKEVDENVLIQLNSRGYIFLRKHTGISGTYFNDSFTCDLETSDYFSIENVRTIDKATRVVRAALLPKLNADLETNNDGTLTLDVITSWENLSDNALEKMKKSKEISGYKSTIDPAQNIGTSSKLKVNLMLVVRGVARNVEVEIGYGTL